MSCWRPLELDELPDGDKIPPLLVKPIFRSNSYTVHLTDLSNIWSEELDLDGIVDRASQEQSPIEVSKQDAAQLALLLENVKKSLASSDDATCRITRSTSGGVTLHAVITLPEPLDSLTWKFYLAKCPSTTLKNELILPLLVSSHIQHERITGLLGVIFEKDKAITRLVDQFESSNLDLSAAFPSVGSLKAGRKAIKREQAAKHVPALQAFREDAWREATGQLRDSDVTTLGLFQEALAQSTPKVPPQLESDGSGTAWWTAIPNELSHRKIKAKAKTQKRAPAANAKTVVESSEDETDDEFETHEHFKARNLVRQAGKAPEIAQSSTGNRRGENSVESTEDEEDLDSLSRSQSQGYKQTTRLPPPRPKSLTPEMPSQSKADLMPSNKARGRGFRIGGKANKAAEKTPTPPPRSPSNVESSPGKEIMPPSSQVDSQASPRKSRRPFRIGGKARQGNAEEGQRAVTPSPKRSRTTATQSPTAEPPSSPPPVHAVTVATPLEETHEETPEEKAERKRAELKRKTEEAARKQAQHKKKKRF